MGSAAPPRPKTNLVHSKAARKPLVAIILNILSTMFYVFEEINWRWCHYNAVTHISEVGLPWDLWVTAAVRRPKGEAPEPARPL